jgi:hypothetical protein
MSRTPVFSTESLAILASLRAETSSGGSSSSNGYIRLPKAVISSRLDEHLWDVFEEIPAMLESVDTLRMVGFKKEAASAILHRWRSFAAANSNLQPSFLDFMTGHIRSYHEDAWELGDDWDRVLERLNIKKQTREGILDSEFTHLRLTNTAKGWALDTIEMLWRHVCALDSMVKENQAKIEYHVQNMERVEASVAGSGC